MKSRRSLSILSLLVSGMLLAGGPGQSLGAENPAGKGQTQDPDCIAVNCSYMKDYENGLKAMETGDYPMADAFFRSAINKNPQDESIVRKGMFFFEYLPQVKLKELEGKAEAKEKNKAEIIFCFAPGMKYGGTFLDDYWSGLVSLKKGKLAMAEEFFQSALKKNPQEGVVRKGMYYFDYNPSVKLRELKAMGAEKGVSRP